MVPVRQHLQTAAHDTKLRLDRLIGIGIGAEGDGRDGIAAPPDLGRQQVRGVGLGGQPGFKIQPRRQPQIGVTGARKAIDAAMFAAPVRVHRAVERNIRRAVARNDRARTFQGQFGRQQRLFFGNVPAIGLAHALIRLIPAIGAGIRATGFYDLIRVAGRQGHAAIIALPQEHFKNMSGGGNC